MQVINKVADIMEVTDEGRASFVERFTYEMGQAHHNMNRSAVAKEMKKLIYSGCLC